MKKTVRENRLTYHCCGRMEERAGVTGEDANRMAHNAVLHGKTSETVKGSDERKYLSEKSSEDIIALAYNGFCFIVRREDQLCITMYALPNWFGKKKHYAGKTLIRNMNRYYKNHRVDDEYYEFAG